MESCNLAWQKPVRHGLTASDPDVAPPQPGKIVDLRAHPIEIRRLRADPANEQFASLGKPNAARRALEQSHTEVLLDIVNSSLHSGRGQVKAVGSLSHRASTRDLFDVVPDAHMT